MSDFEIADHGTIILVTPLSAAAWQWLDENVVAEPWQWFAAPFARTPLRPRPPQ